MGIIYHDMKNGEWPREKYPCHWIENTFFSQENWRDSFYNVTIDGMGSDPIDGNNVLWGDDPEKIRSLMYAFIRECFEGAEKELIKGTTIIWSGDFFTTGLLALLDACVNQLNRCEERFDFHIVLDKGMFLEEKELYKSGRKLLTAYEAEVYKRIFPYVGGKLGEPYETELVQREKEDSGEEDEDIVQIYVKKYSKYAPYDFLDKAYKRKAKKKLKKDDISDEEYEKWKRSFHGYITQYTNLPKDFLPKLNNGNVKSPKAERLLVMALALELNIEETKELLALFSRGLNRSILGHCFVVGFIKAKMYNFDTIDRYLYENDEENDYNLMSLLGIE